MNELLAKISFYNIFNYLVPGAVFVYISKFFIDIDWRESNLVLNLAMIYFAGMVISRIGSVLIEPFLESKRITTRFPALSKGNYADFLEVEKKDPKTLILLESRNTYRTFVSLFVLIPILILGELLIENTVGGLPYWLQLLLLSLFLIVIFVLSFTKQNKYLNDRVATLKGN